MQQQSLKHRLYEEMQPHNEPLLAIIVAVDGPRELWVLGNEHGEASPADIALGEEWVERLSMLQAQASLR